MEQQYSALQQQYPLSSRKFWKKILGQIFSFFFLSLFIGFVFAIIPLLFRMPSPIFAVVSFILGFLLSFSLITILYSWYIKTYIKRYYYDGGESFITIKKRVFSPAEIHVQWQKIQDVYVDQDIIDRIMGLYDVHIASATSSSSIEAHIDGVDQASAEGLKKFFLDKVSGVGRGNVQNANIGQSDQTQQQAVQPKASSINLTEEISNNRYPLSGKWIAMKVVSRAISPFLYWAFLIFYFFVRILKDFSFGSNATLIFWYLIISVLSAIIHNIGLFLWKKNYAFNFTPDNIYFREGVISISEKHMPYSSIQDVTVKQGIIERFLGLASVVIENAAQQAMPMNTRGRQFNIFSGVLLQGLTLEDANKITNILKTTVLGKNTSQYGL